MKALDNYDSIKTDGGSLMPAGAYVCRIHTIEDHTDAASPWLAIYPELFDMATKQFTNTAELASDDTRWHHRLSLSLNGEWGPQRYKRFVSAVERSAQNKGFKYVNADGAEQTLVGKWVGLVVRHNRYTKPNGSDGIRPEISAYLTCDDVINGNYKPEWLEVRDTRTNPTPGATVHAPSAPQAVIGDEDVPF